MAVLPLPGIELRGDGLAKAVLLGGFVDRNGGALMLLALILNQVPVRKSAVSAGAQLIRRFHGLELLDSIRDPSLLRHQVTERNAPAVVRIILANPLCQRLLQVPGPVQGDEQPLLEELPAVVFGV